MSSYAEAVICVFPDSHLFGSEVGDWVEVMKWDDNGSINVILDRSSFSVAVKEDPMTINSSWISEWLGVGGGESFPIRNNINDNLAQDYDGKCGDFNSYGSMEGSVVASNIVTNHNPAGMGNYVRRDVLYRDALSNERDVVNVGKDALNKKFFEMQQSTGRVSNLTNFKRKGIRLGRKSQVSQVQYEDSSFASDDRGSSSYSESEGGLSGAHLNSKCVALDVEVGRKNNSNIIIDLGGGSDHYVAPCLGGLNKFSRPYQLIQEDSIDNRLGGLVPVNDRNGAPHKMSTYIELLIENDARVEEARQEESLTSSGNLASHVS
ncbi:hypothetical protein QYF36_021497 [Acer negundo]|nr:hypothetical protein QYF36_005460 [Acer negundo]KAK4846741.1 hypothetical protein QYF36_021497 [Acer negundo]